MSPSLRGVGFIEALFKVLTKDQSRDFTLPSINYKEDGSVCLPLDSRNIDVICVNCYECLKAKNVEEHSNMCQPSQKFFGKLEEQEVKETNQRLFRLLQGLERTLMTIPNEQPKIRKLAHKIQKIGRNIYKEDRFSIIQLYRSKLHLCTNEGHASKNIGIVIFI